MAYVDLGGEKAVKTLTWDLPPDAIEELCLMLNPSLPLKDYRSLAGKMGFTYLLVKNLDRLDNPTEKLLQHWWSKEGSKTVTDLINLLLSIDRHDAVDLLRKHEYTLTCKKRPSSYGSTSKEPCEMDLINDELEFDNRRHSAHSSFPDDGGDDDYDTDEELNRKMGGLGPCETSDFSNFHPQYLYHQSEQDRSLDTSVSGSVKVDVHTQTGKKVVGNPSINGNNQVEVGVQSEPGFTTISDINSNYGPLMASDKLALLIGNENYKMFSQPLLFPRRDVFAFRCALEKLGFKVLSLVDLTLTEMRTIMLAFCKLLGPNVFSLFYFAGHGYEENGENYLMPIGASPARAASEFMSAQEMLREMQLTQTSLNLVIIDACRVKGVNTTGESRPCGLRGCFGNTIVAYSCQSQMEAFELPQQNNGLYMSELLKNILRDERIEHILMDVNRAVYGNLYAIQRPVFESDAIGDCRLTAKIDSRANYEHWRSRSYMWSAASSPPEPTLITKEDEKMEFKFVYTALYSNMLEIDVDIRHWNECSLCIYDVELLNSSLLETLHHIIKDRLDSGSDWQKMCKFRIFELQKLDAELHIVLELKVKNDSETNAIEIKHNLKFPLISSYLQEFQSWITSEPPSALV